MSINDRDRAPRLANARLGKWVALGACFVLALSSMASSCRRQSNVFVIALSDNVKTIDPIGSPSVDAASERVRSLMFNSLVKKDEKFDYVPELASKIDRSEDGLTFTFTLRDGVTFHDGRPFTSADAKYTLDTVLASTFAKAASFFEGVGATRTAYVKSVDAPDAHTLVIRLNSPWTGLLANLVAIAIIPKDSYESQKTHPLGTGPFKFKSYDQSQQVVDMEANPNYWDGPTQIPVLRARVISDSNALQAELQSGRVDIAPLPTSLSPDAIKGLGANSNLTVHQFAGSNLNLLTFNTTEPPLDNVKVRQAIAYAINRESMIRDLVLGQGKIAHSILPEESWAYTPGQTYHYDPAMAKKLLDDAGFRDPDGDGPQMRFSKPIIFRISGSSGAARQYSGVIYNYLREVGIPVSIETSELNTLFEFLRRGQFQMTYGQWVGGNQDPIFYRDLFATSEIPSETRAARNRSRYSNPELDKILEEATNTYDHAKAAPLYARAQEIVSRDVVVLPLWYQANMVIAKKSVGNIHINASGDWGFVKDLTVGK
ncbi:MAG TPA: ABC transporter substrate-binding protein [Pyrinomonadaceae bacterium]|nr:ABC transporter substrate-binding protein [Pyrinomonadaceae bacterium]